MSVWIYDPLILMLSPPAWPLCRQLTTKESQNALAQIVVAVGIGLSIYKNTTLPLAIALSILVANYLLWDMNQKSNSSTMSSSSCEEKKVSQMRHPVNLMAHEAPGCPPSKSSKSSKNTARNGVLPWSPQSYQYPNNPNVFDYGQAVRGKTCPMNPKTQKLNIAVPQESSLARMYSSPEIYPIDQNITPLPDPTFSARQPFCHKSQFEKSNDFMDQGKMRMLY